MTTILEGSYLLMEGILIIHKDTTVDHVDTSGHMANKKGFIHSNETCSHQTWHDGGLW